MKKTIFLSGKIDGLSEVNAMKWRREAKEKLQTYAGIKVTMPQYDTNVNLLHQNETWDRDYFLVDNCDILLVNFNYEPDSPFLGTSMEIARAYYQHKPIIIMSNKNWVKNNFTLKYHASYMANDLDDAIDYIRTLL